MAKINDLACMIASANMIYMIMVDMADKNDPDDMIETFGRLKAQMLSLMPIVESYQDDKNRNKALSYVKQWIVSTTDCPDMETADKILKQWIATNLIPSMRDMDQRLDNRHSQN